MMKPEVLVLKADGINCDVETAYAFSEVGAQPTTVHVNELISGEQSLENFQILALAGGFSYGDDIASGRVLANKLVTRFDDELQTFADQGKPIIGICNGFQVLVKSGLLPFGNLGQQTMTLTDNTSGRFESRWVDLMPQPSACAFFQPRDFYDQPIPMHSAHAEGRFFTKPSYAEYLQKMHEDRQVVFTYATPDGGLAVGYPENPNGSLDNIAGVCSPNGLTFGLMPHPERSFGAFHPDRLRTDVAREAGQIIFSGMTNYAKEM